MSSIAHNARGFAYQRRTTVVAAMSAIVFILALLSGVALSRIGVESAATVSSNAEPLRSSVTTEPIIPLAPQNGPVWKVVEAASTDFATSALDSAGWGIYNGAGNAGVGLRRPSAVTAGNGELRIKATGKVSGGLSQDFSQTYGRWVVRARMEKGQGYGPAILLWPDSEKWPEDGEIDFAEMPKADRSAVVMTSHWGKDNSQVSKSVEGDFSDWHTFAVDWLPDHLSFYVDGIEQFRVTDPAAIPTKPMHLAIQNDVGACDSWIGCRNSSTPKTVSLYVSSVRVYSPA